MFSEAWVVPLCWSCMTNSRRSCKTVLYVRH
uniref:Uncharacterized protein n=1 Tax=Anguilla anguilla TaxID=7936 RepID=A0A0E9VKA3_ANGAN